MHERRLSKLNIVDWSLTELDIVKLMVKPGEMELRMSGLKLKQRLAGLKSAGLMLRLRSAGL